MKTFAVVGDPVDRSMSPNIHNAAYKALGIDAAYIAYRIKKGELEEGVESLKEIRVAGFNVTIPHKIQIMEYLDKVDEVCSVIGAANTVSNKDGVLRGYNTDMDGFLDPIRKRDIAIKGESVLLFGAGGAARAIVAGFAKEGATKISIVNKTLQNAKELARFAGRLGIDGQAVDVQDVQKSHRFVINATPSTEPPAGCRQHIDDKTVVYDIVYAPMNTGLIQTAKRTNAVVVYGYEMLLWQAARAFEIWHETGAPYEAMKTALVGRQGSDGSGNTGFAA